MVVNKNLHSSKYLVSIIKSLLQSNKDLAKYLINNTETPLKTLCVVDDDTFDPQTLLMKKVFPFPFDSDTTKTEGVQLRMFFAKGMFDANTIIQDRVIVFDIICSKNLWLLKDDTISFRPYDIRDNIVSWLAKHRIDNIGKIVFKEESHLMINEIFSGIRLLAEVTSFHA